MVVSLHQDPPETSGILENHVKAHEETWSLITTGTEAVSGIPR